MDSLAGAAAVFLLSALFVVLAGVGLARYGDDLAESTGWGKLWVGTLLVASATSLPEVTVNVAAVWLERSPGLALGNVFGADMINVCVLAVVALVFGVGHLFANQGRDTKILILLGLALVATAALMGLSGDMALGPTSLGGLLILALYVAGMRAVYRAGRAAPAEALAPGSNARRAWIGFGVSVAVVIVAGRFLAASADRIAELSGISASFVGVLLVSIVTTLPEASVTFTAALRRSYGIAMGNVYGSNAFNVVIFAVSDLFHDGPLLAEMRPAHFAAAGGAMLLMLMGYIVWRACQRASLGVARAVTPAIPLVWIGALYLVFRLAQA